MAECIYSLILRFCRDCPWRMGFFDMFFVSVDLQFYTSRKCVLFGEAEMVSIQTF